MFRKKKGDTDKDANGTGSEAGNGSMPAPPLKPFSKKGSHAPAKPPSAASFHPDIPRRAPPEIPGLSARRSERSLSGIQDSKQLLIGRDISLSGEIISCSRLVVEGRAEVAIEGAEIIEVTPSGFFKGSADVEEADISGRFEGELTARNQLIVRNGGRVSGTIRYGKIVIEAGGEISGDMKALEPVSEEEKADGGEDPDSPVIVTPKRKRGSAKTPAEEK